MNTQTFSVFVIGLSEAGFAAAQSVALRANVPFSFVLNGKTLPAGEYSVVEGTSQGMMIIRGVGQAGGAIS
jgi:adenine/guanine phosphoribosyltransferase-like PRPP-binding protein